MAEIKGDDKGIHTAGLSSVPVKINKQLEGDNDNEIETRPTYINHVHLVRTGSNVFMDIGVVPTDDLLGFREKQEVRFIVLDRLVMGLETFMALHDAVSQLHGQLKEAGILPSEKIIKT